MVLSCLIIQSNCFILSRDFYVYIPPSARFHFFYIETSIRMDVAPDQDVLDFLNDLGKEEVSAGTSQVATAVNEKEKEIRYEKSSYYIGKFSTNNR